MDLIRIGKREVAALAGVNLQTLNTHIYGQRECYLLAGLPPPIRSPYGARKLWIRQDILDWLEMQRTFVGYFGEISTQDFEELARSQRELDAAVLAWNPRQSSQPPRRRPGRPRKQRG